MNRPYIICHILSALDGKIAGPFMEMPENIKAAKEYSHIREEFNADAWLYGTTTTKEFTDFKKPDLSQVDENIDDGDFVANNQSDLYYVSVDTFGEIGWDSSTYKRKGRKDAHIIEILVENTSKKYRSYLRNKGISYIIAGKENLDCKLAVSKLKDLFGIEKMLICGGGIVNWTFVSQEVVDELSLLLSPVADGENNTPTVFEHMLQSDDSKTVIFHLENVSQLPNDIVHLRYTIKKSEI